MLEDPWFCRSQNERVRVPLLAAEVMSETGVWWAVAGGWAIDLWLGEQTREHHDVEVVVRRCDQALVHEALSPRWELACLDPPGEGWRQWSGTGIEPPAFQLQARSPTLEFDIFNETADDTVWHVRRDHRITRPLPEVTTLSSSGIPIVRPEVQLLYMANSTEAKNQHDFQATRPTLNRASARVGSPRHLRSPPQVTRGLHSLTKSNRSGPIGRELVCSQLLRVSTSPAAYTSPISSTPG
jgi:hypothetical protein